jgi:hypothetical protein
MILRNTGKSEISYNDGGAIGVALPNSNFQVSDAMGRYLKRLYPTQIENLEDAVKKFKDDTSGKAYIAPVVVAKKSAHALMLEETAKAAEPVKAEKDPEAKAPAAKPPKAEKAPKQEPKVEEPGEGDDLPETGKGEKKLSPEEQADMDRLEQLTKPDGDAKK